MPLPKAAEHEPGPAELVGSRRKRSFPWCGSGREMDVSSIVAGWEAQRVSGQHQRKSSETLVSEPLFGSFCADTKGPRPQAKSPHAQTAISGKACTRKAHRNSSLHQWWSEDASMSASLVSFWASRKKLARRRNRPFADDRSPQQKFGDPPSEVCTTFFFFLKFFICQNSFNF